VLLAIIVRGHPDVIALNVENSNSEEIIAAIQGMKEQFDCNKSHAHNDNMGHNATDFILNHLEIHLKRQCGGAGCDGKLD
jgi:hypothetical protein